MGRTGIMGGTFNPVHIAHIKMAEAAYRQAGLDKVVFMPSKNPPQKKYPYNSRETPGCNA